MTVVIIRENGDSIILEGATATDINSEKLVPTHPIEARSDEPGELRGIISDSARRLPTSVSISGIISDSPLERVEGFVSIVDFLAFLDEVNRTNELVTIQNNYELHENMILAAYPRNYGATQSTTYNLIFQQVETAIREIVAIPSTTPAPRAADTMSNRRELGATPDKVLGEAREKQAKSLAAGLLDVGAGFFRR
jgi:hypothetical protein